MIGMEAFGNAVKFQEFKENDISYDCLTNGKLADTDFAKYFYLIKIPFYYFHSSFLTYIVYVIVVTIFQISHVHL